MRTKNKPLVSVIITAYNAEKYIGLAVTSIINQTYQNLEIIIVDDKSTDSTFRIAKMLAKNDSRIRVYSMNRHGGPGLASNLGLRKAKGNFIARMDADDIALPHRLEKQLDFLLHHPQVIIVGGQCELIDEKGKIIGEKKYPITHKDIYTSLFTRNPIQHPACMFRRDLLPNRKIYYHNHSLLAHDLELVFELSKYGKLANLPEIVLQYRLHKDSLSLRNPKATFKATIAVRRKAVQKYHYLPPLRSKVIHYLQLFFIPMLPNSIIFVLFHLLKIKKNANPFTTIQVTYRFICTILF